jgi:hypothetical protein
VGASSAGGGASGRNEEGADGAKTDIETSTKVKSLVENN